MDFCTHCGAALGLGRFCTNCGQPLTAADAPAESWRTDTAERPRVTVPPPVQQLPEPPRYPLFADDGQRAEEERSLWVPPDPGGRPPRHRGDYRWLPWALGFVLLALIASLGGWLLFAGEDEPLLAQDTPASSSPRGEEDSAATPAPDPRTDTNPATTSAGVARRGDRALAPATNVSAPAAAPPSEDSSGNTVQFVAANMLDGVAETTWRMPGDGTGESITFRFDSPPC